MKTHKLFFTGTYLATAVVAAMVFSSTAQSRTYYVSAGASKDGDGSETAPLKTIQAAAELAQPGDVVLVKAGIYREWVKPQRGGKDASTPITYQAAEGDKVVITGSDAAKGWVKTQGDVWALTLPNSYFGKFNPFVEIVSGDWFNPRGRTHHRGCVYLNGEWLAEAKNKAEMMAPKDTALKWFAEVSEPKNASGKTTIYARFIGKDPNQESVEISVRPTVFTPEKIGVNYVTVRGFILRQAATNWAAPTAGQYGLVSAYWCKGWTIERNEICYSRCCGIALGKYADENDGKLGSKEGYDKTITNALKAGWSKEQIGGHLVKDNIIHHCGQTGVVGSLGGAFSKIIGNEIHDINMQGIWSGAEMAGIKLHAAIDVVISGNHIYRCGPTAGIWLDWMAQGTQITDNFLHDNGAEDLFTEVNHGPFLVANNIFLSPHSYRSNSQGGAFVNNILVGNFRVGPDPRSTPFHKAHSTELAGTHNCPLGELRWYNNIFVGRASLTAYNRAALPIVAADNVYLSGAAPSKFDKNPVVVKDVKKPSFKLQQQADGWYLSINATAPWLKDVGRKIISSQDLGVAKFPNLPFENPDGSAYRIDADYFGKARDKGAVLAGPFAALKDGEQSVKVWPRK